MKQLKEQEYEEFQQYPYNKKHGYIWTRTHWRSSAVGITTIRSESENKCLK